MNEARDEADYVLVLTGVLGSGKSKAGNIILNDEVFPSKWSLKPVTKESASSTRNVGGKGITVIDTPGFLDPSSLTKLEEFKGFAKAIVDMPDGIHAVGLVINIANRVTEGDAKLLEMLLAAEDMIPYAFLIFTHAKALAETEEEQKQLLDSVLKDKNECPEVLQRLLSQINNRYILLESMNYMGEGYFTKKSQEILEVLRQIKTNNRKPYTCAINELAEKLRKVDDKEALVEALTKDIEKVQEALSKEKSINKNNAFWINLLIYVGGGIGLGAVGAGAVGLGLVYSSALVAGASQVYQYISRNPETVKGILNGIAQIIGKLPKPAIAM